MNSRREEDDDIIEVGFHMGLCPEYEEEKLLACMDYLHDNVKYIIIIEAEQGITYPYNRLICNKKYVLEAFDHDESTIDLEIKKGKVKKFISYIEETVEEFEFLFDFSKEIGATDFQDLDVITTGLLVSRVALEGELPGLASKMAFVCITTP